MLPKELVTLRCMLRRGLDHTALLWPAIERAFGWVHQAAHILANEENRSGAEVRQQFSGLLGAMSHWRAQAGGLAPSVDRFLKVTRSYWPGLFPCYDIAGLPRTNNDLEHLFGSFRYHERRASGRKVAAPSVVVRGPARLIAAVATRQRTFSAADLAHCDVQAWRVLRASIDTHRQSRISQQRFRRNSAGFLESLEARLLKLTLPP